MRLEKVSAQSPPLDEACSYAGFPPIEGVPTFCLEDNGHENGKTTALKPWQPSAVAWLMRQLESPLHGGILADACGLGKTLTSLCLIYLSGRRTLNRDPSTIFRASLVVVPARIILQSVTRLIVILGLESTFGPSGGILCTFRIPSARKEQLTRPRTFYRS